MIESRWGRGACGDASGGWRRAHEVLDDYDRGGVLSEQLADDLCSELAALPPSSLGPRNRPGRPRRGPRTGPQPSRPVTTPPVMARPRLVLVRE